jgi:hypothetical protein
MQRVCEVNLPEFFMGLVERAKLYQERAPVAPEIAPEIAPEVGDLIEV